MKHSQPPPPPHVPKNIKYFKWALNWGRFDTDHEYALIPVTSLGERESTPFRFIREVIYSTEYRQAMEEPYSIFMIRPDGDWCRIIPCSLMTFDGLPRNIVEAHRPTSYGSYFKHIYEVSAVAVMFLAAQPHARSSMSFSYTLTATICCFVLEVACLPF